MERSVETGRGRRWQWVLILLGGLAIALFCLIYPLYIIWPFRYQGARELQAALLVVRIRPVVATLSAAAAVVAVVLYWRVQRRWLWRIATGLVGAVVCLAAALCRINVYEVMFHPMGRPAFLAARDTKLDGDEEVIAVKAGGAARAYPIRSLSYHHIANDWLGGVPIVATY